MKSSPLSSSSLCSLSTTQSTEALTRRKLINFSLSPSCSDYQFETKNCERPPLPDYDEHRKNEEVSGFSGETKKKTPTSHRITLDNTSILICASGCLPFPSLSLSKKKTSFFPVYVLQAAANDRREKTHKVEVRVLSVWGEGGERKTTKTHLLSVQRFHLFTLQPRRMFPISAICGNV